MRQIAFTLVAQPKYQGATLEDARAFLVPAGMTRDAAITAAMGQLLVEQRHETPADVWHDVNFETYQPGDFTWELLAPPEVLR